MLAEKKIPNSLTLCSLFPLLSLLRLHLLDVENAASYGRHSSIIGKAAKRTDELQFRRSCKGMCLFDFGLIRVESSSPALGILEFTSGTGASGKKKYMGHLKVRSHNGLIDESLLDDPWQSSATLASSYDAADEVNMWTRKYSFALEMFDEIFRTWKGNQIARCLDYDGTLSPIVNEPDKAYMSGVNNGQMRAMVKGVVSYFPIEIVCGRCKDKV